MTKRPDIRNLVRDDLRGRVTDRVYHEELNSGAFARVWVIVRSRLSGRVMGRIGTPIYDRLLQIILYR